MKTFNDYKKEYLQAPVPVLDIDEIFIKTPSVNPPGYRWTPLDMDDLEEIWDTAYKAGKDSNE